MSNPACQPARWTAAQIAAALDISKQAVQKTLQGVRGGLVVDGRKTHAWALDALPETLRERLETRARQLNCRDAAVLLAHPLACWEPEIPLARIAEECLEQARKLQRAQAHALAVRNEPGVALGDLLVRGHALAFGYKITPQHALHLFNRTLQRAGAGEEFGRLELYLPERLKQREAAQSPPPLDGEFELLAAAVRGFRIPGQPTEREAATLWDRSFKLLRESGGERAFKRRLLAWLFKHAPFLARNENALRVSFDRKHARWLDAGSNPRGIFDQRKGRTRVQLPLKDRDTIVGMAVFRTRGRISQAVREAGKAGLLSAETQARINPAVARKSYVPQAIRREVTAETRTLLRYSRKGGRDAVTPPMDLNYDGIRSMNCLQSDDFTPNFYFYVPDGKGWYRLTRGQFLPVIDFRSLRVLGFALHPEGQYNSAIIRTVFTRAFAQWGLPKRLYLERGIWKSSRLIVGKKPDAGLPLTDEDCEAGLRAYGIEFTHAKRARSKPVERCGGLWWDLLDGEPGFCGREERKDRPEWLDRQMREVESRRVHPSKYFYDLDQAEARFHEIITRYNATPQQGKRLRGLSPDEAFERFWPHDDPPTLLPPECRYLLAHHRLPVEVKAGGIAFTINSRTYRFFDGETGARIGQKLLAWFNPEVPELCTFTTPDHRDPFTLPLHESPNALATDDVFVAETERAAAHAAQVRTRYRDLKAQFRPVFRANLVDGRTAKLGVEIDRQQGELTAVQREQETKLATARRMAHELGVPFSDRVDDLDRALEGLRMQREALKELEAET